MNFGVLSVVAVEAIDWGCALAGCLHNTGEVILTGWIGSIRNRKAAGSGRHYREFSRRLTCGVGWP